MHSEIEGPTGSCTSVTNTEPGGPINHFSLVARLFVPALKAAGIKDKVRFHDLRHTWGKPFDRTGRKYQIHSSPTVTLNVYAHLLKSVNQEAARRLDNFVFSADGDQIVTNTQKGVTASTVTP